MKEISSYTDTFYTDILAKPSESLLEHVNNALEFLKKTLEWNKRSIEYVEKEFALQHDELRSRLFATVYLHDIGKASHSFQKYIKSNSEIKSSFPHALLSLPFVLAATKPLESDGSEIRIEAMAVMSHHTPFYDNLYSTLADNVPNKFVIQKPALEFFYSLSKAYKNNFGSDYSFELQEPDLNSDLTKVLAIIKNPLKITRPKGLREIHSLFVAILHYSDWLASGKMFDYRYSIEDVSDPMKTHVSRKKGFSDWYEMQKKASSINGSMILNAPTGQGKTEAALLWAQSNLNIKKILYLLPTRVTTNAIFERLREFLGDDVALSHATSTLFIGEQERWEEPKVRVKHLLWSSFMSPITVATVDQLLLSLFNWRHWELVHQNASGSLIILDEVHSYDYYTLSLISEMMKTLRPHKVRFAIMSATLPRYVETHFKKLFNNNIKVLKDKEHVNLRRHKINFVSDNIFNAIELIVSHYKKRKKILIILNTVKDAISVYNALRINLNNNDIVPNVMLYHSRFIEKHRKLKEDQIKKGEKGSDGFIVVATQVVEVSLDIDYDVLFTQIAPLDALVQRLGRVNRIGEKLNDNTNVFIYKEGDDDHLVYGLENLKRATELVENELHDETPTEKDISRLIEIQYPEKESLNSFEQEWQEVIDDLDFLHSQLWDVQSILHGDRLDTLYKIASTRKEKMLDIEVIPEMFRNDVESGNKLQAQYYVVRIPFYRFKSCISKGEMSSWIFADIDYSLDEGAVSCKSESVII